MRPPTPRPPAEHHATLSRVLRQVSADSAMKKPRKERITEALSDILEELQKEMASK